MPDITFAQHFAQLVWLLLNESAAIDDQKAALRSAMMATKDGPVTLAVREWRLLSNGEMVPETLTGVQDLAAQIVGHSVHELIVGPAAAPADLLGVARILAGEPLPGDFGRGFQDKLTQLGAKTVRAVLETPQEIIRPSGSMPTITAGISANVGTPPSSQTVEPPRMTGSMATIGGDDEGKYLAFAAIQAPKGSVADLLGQLDESKNVNVSTRLLDDIVQLAETSQREGKLEMVADAFYGVVSREAKIDNADLKRAYVMAIRRMSKPTLLRATAQLIPKSPSAKSEELMLVITRAGEDGADALIEQLVAAQSVTERRIFFNALVKLNAGVPALIHMLGDARWYVVRNAAELLGEMGAADGEQQLIELLKHDDDRVRRAVSMALAKLGTPKAVDALRKMLKDPAPQVRLQAAIGLSALKGVKTATTLTTALDDEEDQEVQMALIGALGKVATPDAVQKLIKAAEPETRLFRRKATPFRVAAVQALGDARTPAALTALQSLLQDKDKEVRDAVFRITMLSPRQTGEHTPVGNETIQRKTQS